MDILLYILLILHYGFYVFFILAFLAFIYTYTNSKEKERYALFFLLIYSLCEFIYTIYLLFSSNEYSAWGVLIVGWVLSSIMSISLWIIKKGDITLCLPLSIIFTPIVPIPALFFLLVFNLYKTKNYSPIE